AGVVSANTGPFSRLRSAAGPAIRLQMSAARALLESHCMARTCTICSHPKLVNIDRQLLRGDMLNGIAHRFHVSPDAVGRHRRHIRTAMLKAPAAAEKGRHCANLMCVLPRFAFERRTRPWRD